MVGIAEECGGGRGGDEPVEVGPKATVFDDVEAGGGPDHVKAVVAVGVVNVPGIGTRGCVGPIFCAVEYGPG